MPHRHIETIGHFIAWGAIYGLLLGGLCGTLIFPIFGTMYAGPWGLGIGLTLGVIVGIAVVVINAIGYNAPYDLVAYRRKFTLGVSIFVAIGAAFLLTVTTQGFLWGPGTDGFFPYFLPSLLGAMFWGGLSSAYATSWYADWYAGMINKQKNDSGVEDALPQKYGIMQRLTQQMFRREWRLLLLFSVVFGLYLVTMVQNINAYSSYNAYSLWRVISEVGYGVGFVFGSLIVCIMTGGYLILFVTRIFLLEHQRFQSAQQLQRFVRGMVCGFFALIVATFSMQTRLPYIQLPQLLMFGILAFVLIYSGWHMTEGFGEWYFREEKVKSKPKVELEVMEEAIA